MSESTYEKRKQVIEKVIQFFAYEYYDPSNYNAYLEGPFGKRRTAVLLKNMDALEESARKYGVEEFDFSLAQREMRPITNFDFINDEEDVSLGAALWILEQLRLSDTLPYAMPLLPQVDADEHMLRSCYHPLFSEELILSVMKLLPKECMTEEYAKRTSVVHTPFIGITDNIPTEKVIMAVERFKRSVWQIIDIYLQLDAYYDQKIMREKALYNQRFSGGILRTDQSRDSEDSAREEAKAVMMYEDYLSDTIEIRKNLRLYFEMDRKALKKILGSGKMADTILSLQLPDPYEACFAFFYMLEHGDDTIWMLNTCCDVLILSMNQLPWRKTSEEDELLDEFDDDDDPWWDDDEEDEEDDPSDEFNCDDWIERNSGKGINYFREKKGKSNLAQVIYDMSGCLVPNMHPFADKTEELIEGGMDPQNAAAVVAAAEILHLACFRSELPGSTRLHPEQTKLPEEDRKPGNKTAEDKPSTSFPVDEEAQENWEEKVRELQESLDRVRRENKSLKASLSEQKRSYDYELSKAEKQITELMLEHRELADLREYIYNHENDVEEPETASESEFPYHIEKKTIIVGGHETWLKAIRPMIPDARYVEANNYSFSQDLIRGADQVWIQPNRMAHAQFYNIIGLCRKYSIPVRYFSFASAEKCARQLIDAEQNKD